MRLQTLAPLLLIVVPALAVEDQKGTDIAAGIDFQVASEKSVYAPYEPVIVKYWIYNRSDQEIRVPGAIAFNAGWVRLDVGAAGGKFQPYYTGSVASGFLGDIRLGPGEKRGAQVIMLTNGRGIIGARMGVRIPTRKLLFCRSRGRERIPYALGILLRNPREMRRS